MRGMTLTELTVVLVLLSLLLGQAVPRVADLRDRLVVEHETSRITAAYARARLTALRSGGRTLLRVTPDSTRIWELQGSDSVAVWGAAGPILADVQFSSNIPRVVFGPNGTTMGVVNGRITLQRGTVKRGLVASRLGRLRVDRNP